MAIKTYPTAEELAAMSDGRRSYYLRREKRAGYLMNRYWNEPGFKERIRACERQRATRQKSQTLVEEVAIRGARVYRVKEEVPIFRSWNGEKTAFFNHQMLCRVLKVSMSGLRTWESRGQFPRTPFRSEQGHRLYTLRMVDVARDVFLRKGGMVAKERETYHEVAAGWQALGVTITPWKSKEDADGADAAHGEGDEAVQEGGGREPEGGVGGPHGGHRAA